MRTALSTFAPEEERLLLRAASLLDLLSELAADLLVATARYQREVPVLAFLDEHVAPQTIFPSDLGRARVDVPVLADTAFARTQAAIARYEQQILQLLER